MTSGGRYGATEECKASEVPSRWYHVDKAALPAKMCFFFVNMKESAYIPYIILYLSSVGLTVTQAGVIAGMRLIGMLLGAPLWGIVDDRLRRPQLLISLLCLASAILMIQMPFIAATLQPSASRCAWIQAPGGNVTLNVSCYSKLSSNQTCRGCSGSSDNLDSQRQFWFHLMASLLMTFFDGALLGLTDSAVMSMIERSRRHLDFGRQRVFGAVGFGVGCFVSSVVLGYETKPFPGLSKYWPIFFVYVFAVLCYAGSAFMLFRMNLIETKQSDRKDTRLLRALSETISQWRVVFFLSTALFIGVLFGLVNSFTFKLLDDLNAPDIVMGLTVVLGAVGCVFLFFFTTQLIYILGGPMSAIGVAAFVYFVRFVVYGYGRSPYLILAIQAIHCFAFAPFVASAVMWINLISPKEISSTMYSIYNGLHFGAGSMLANWLGGLLYDQYGGPWLFKAAAVATLIWTLLIALYVLKEKCRRGNNRKPDREAHGFENDISTA